MEFSGADIREPPPTKKKNGTPGFLHSKYWISVWIWGFSPGIPIFGFIILHNFHVSSPTNTTWLSNVQPEPIYNPEIWGNVKPPSICCNPDTWAKNTIVARTTKSILKDTIKVKNNMARWYQAQGRYRNTVKLKVRGNCPGSLKTGSRYFHLTPKYFQDFSVTISQHPGKILDTIWRPKYSWKILITFFQ